MCEGSVEGYQNVTSDQIERDHTLRGAIERYLYLVIQSAIDCAEVVIAFHGFRRPTTYSEAFDILKEENIIPADLAEELIRMTGFRNVIAHDYVDVDVSVMSDILHHHLSDIEKFIHAVQTKLSLK